MSIALTPSGVSTFGDFRRKSDAEPRVAVRVRDLADVQIKGGVHGPLVQLRALSNKTLAALLVQIKVRVRRLEPASNDRRETAAARSRDA